MRSISPYQLPLFVEKRCTRCGVVQWLDNFPLDPRVPGRHKSWCKACCGAYQREWNARASVKDRFADRRALLALPENAPPRTAEKPCTHCGVTHWLGDFPIKPRSGDGRGSWCKACGNVATHASYERHKKRLAARAPMPTPIEKQCSTCGVIKPADAFQFDRLRPGQLKAQCKDCHAAAEQERRDRDREGYNAWARRRRQADPTRNREFARRYAVAHPEKVKAYLAQWRRENQDVCNAYSRNRHALKLKAKGRHTKADLDAIFSAQAGLCFYCGIGLVKPIHVDHKIPLSRGGSNGPDNLALSCQTCNLQKHTKTDGEYRAWLAAHPR